MQLQKDDLFSRHQQQVQFMMDQVATRNRVLEGEPKTSPFASILANGIGRVNEMQLQSEDLVEQLLSGEAVNQAEVFTSVQKADMSFRLLVQIRNKLMQAYEELNSIRV
jgi:flagellar hook-basal body complex protein FliE